MKWPWGHLQMFRKSRDALDMAEQDVERSHRIAEVLRSAQEHGDDSFLVRFVRDDSLFGDAIGQRLHKPPRNVRKDAPND